MTESEDSAKYDIPIPIPQSIEMSRLKPASLSPGWRIANVIMAVFFFLAAMANTNDNDWYIWTPIYLYASGLCLVAFLYPTAIDNRVWQTLMSIQLGVTLVMCVYQVSLVLGIAHKMATNPLFHEEGREMGGIIIILAWTGISRFSPFKSTASSHTRSGSSTNLMTGLLVVSLTLAVVPLVTWSLCFVGDWHKRLGHCSGMFR